MGHEGGGGVLIYSLLGKGDKKMIKIKPFFINLFLE